MDDTQSCRIKRVCVCMGAAGKPIHSSRERAKPTRRSLGMVVSMRDGKASLLSLHRNIPHTYFQPQNLVGRFSQSFSRASLLLQPAGTPAGLFQKRKPHLPFTPRTRGDCQCWAGGRSIEEGICEFRHTRERITHHRRHGVFGPSRHHYPPIAFPSSTRYTLQLRNDFPLPLGPRRGRIMRQKAHRTTLFHRAPPGKGNKIKQTQQHTKPFLLFWQMEVEFFCCR